MLDLSLYLQVQAIDKRLYSSRVGYNLRETRQLKEGIKNLEYMNDVICVIRIEIFQKLQYGRDYLIGRDCVAGHKLNCALQKLK